MYKKSYKKKLFSLLLAVLLSAIWVAPAFADEPAPQDIPTDTTSVDEQPAEEQIVTDETPPPFAGEVDSGEATESTPAEFLEQIPENVEVVVLDSAGEPIPLVSAEAEEIILTKDPMWCPAGVAPKAGVGGCSNSYASLAELIADIYAGNYIPAAKNSVIWIEQGMDNSTAYSFSPVVIDGAHPNFELADDFGLTLKGGWVYNTTGAQTINQNNPTELNVPLVITGWLGAVTLSDIEISSQTSNAGSDTALIINTTKNIQLDRVTVEDNENTTGGANYRSGTFLDNSSGTGNVIINNSSFNNNEASGLQVYSKGSITINGIVANSNNLGSGVYLNNNLAVGGKPIIIKGFKQFNNNFGSGLDIATTGVVTISNLVASGNGSYGVNINNVASTTKAGVTIGGTNQFDANGADGLYILSAGAITVSNINAFFNGDSGVELDNCNYDFGNNWCQATVSKPITVLGTNLFDSNGHVGSEPGLLINSFGAVTLNNITANYNFEGVHVFNDYGNLNALNNTGGITLKGYAKLTGNDHGASFESYGNVTLTNLFLALHTQEGGLDIYAVKPGTGVANVTITGVNQYLDNSGSFFIQSDGKVTLSNITAINNVNGAVIDNTGGLGVTLTGVNNFSGNGVNLEHGLLITSSGPVLISNITSNGNLKSGLSINNQANPTKPMAVTLTGYNTFNNNTQDGLEILSYGVITLNNVTAINNSSKGIDLDNCDYNGSTCDNTKNSAVNILGFVNATGNGSIGLEVLSNGVVTTNNVTANNNGSHGMLVQNQFNNLKPMNITLKGVNSFGYNTGTGIAVYSYGVITVSNITANFNGTSGAILDNRISNTYVTEKAITLIGINSFNENYYDGLNFAASGNFTASSAIALGNDGFSNAYSGKGISGYSSGNIIMSCVIVTDNEHQGLAISAGVNTITLKGYYSYLNGLADSMTAGTVTITRACTLP